MNCHCEGTQRLKQSMPFLFLVLFCLAAWFFIFSPPLFEKQKPAFAEPESILGPLTIQQKILLRYKLSLQELSAKDWESLPKIGPKKAETIAQYQQSHEPFQAVDDLLEVKGIGPKIVETIRPFFK